MADTPQPLAVPPTAYANNVQLEPSEFDLRLVFGEQSQSPSGGIVRPLVGVRLSWLEAKLLSYFLQVTLAGYELHSGKINVPKSTIPPEPTPIPEEHANDPEYKAIHEKITAMHKDFIASI
jgi:hypothetical protein